MKAFVVEKIEDKNLQQVLKKLKKPVWQIVKF